VTTMVHARTTEPTLEPAHIFHQVHDACDFGLQILIFTPSTRSWVICCDVRSCQRQDIHRGEARKHREKHSHFKDWGILHWFTWSRHGTVRHVWGSSAKVEIHREAATKGRSKHDWRLPEISMFLLELMQDGAYWWPGTQPRVIEVRRRMKRDRLWHKKGWSSTQTRKEYNGHTP
jgi:hypothetical protein